MSERPEKNDAPVVTRVLAAGLVADDMYQNHIKNSMVWAVATTVVLPVGLRVARWAINRRRRRKDARKK
jgi:hypothetical protein